MSTKKQADAGNLERQLERLRAYARKKGYRVVAEHCDVAFGLNQNRRGLERALKAAERGEFKKLLIEYPDRMARFGYAYLERHLKHCGVEIEVTSQKEPEDAHAELVQDLLSIVTSFSARLYGARGGRKIRQGFRELIRDAEEAGER
ncbi:MAG: IS607 family transposase [Moorellales bacterium]